MLKCEQKKRKEKPIKKMKIFQPFFGWLVEFKTATNRSKGGAEGGACHFLFFVFARNLNSFTNNIYTVHRVRVSKNRDFKDKKIFYLFSN